METNSTLQNQPPTQTLPSTLKSSTCLIKMYIHCREKINCVTSKFCQFLKPILSPEHITSMYINAKMKVASFIPRSEVIQSNSLATQCPTLIAMEWRDTIRSRSFMPNDNIHHLQCEQCRAIARVALRQNPEVLGKVQGAVHEEHKFAGICKQLKLTFHSFSTFLAITSKIQSPATACTSYRP